MKKLLLVGLCLFFLSGCAAMHESEFLQHDSLYKNFDHGVFSIENSFGAFRHYVTLPEDAVMSQEQGWWGIDTQPLPPPVVVPQTGNHIPKK